MPYLHLIEPGEAFHSLVRKSSFSTLAWKYFISNYCYIQGGSAEFGREESRLNSMPGECCLCSWSGLWNISFPSHCPTFKHAALSNILFICVMLLSMVLTRSRAHYNQLPKYTCTKLFYMMETQARPVSTGAQAFVLMFPLFEFLFLTGRLNLYSNSKLVKIYCL